MTGTIPAVREIVIVIADLYLPTDSTTAGGASYASGSAASASLANAAGGSPGLEHVARFGQRRALDGEGGWRAWLARWLGRGDLADVPPAVVVAAGLDPGTAGAKAAGVFSLQGVGAEGPGASASPDIGAQDSGASFTRGLGAEGPAVSSTIWLATPVHFIAGLTSIHLDRRGLLHLSAAELDDFAADFNRTFGGGDPATALRLQPLPASGQFLLQAPANLNAMTTEPAHALAADLEASLPKGPQAAPFKRLGAELEMWLHAHPLNEARRRRGELPVSTLWLWGGGPSSEALQRPAAHPDSAAVAFGNDPYLRGLAGVSGADIRVLPNTLADVIGCAQRAVLVDEITPLLHANPQWTLFEAAADIDRRLIGPALTALHARRLEAVTLIANNLEMRVSRGSRLRFWRPRQPGLSGLVVR